MPHMGNVVVEILSAALQLYEEWLLQNSQRMAVTETRLQSSTYRKLIVNVNSYCYIPLLLDDQVLTYVFDNYFLVWAVLLCNLQWSLSTTPALMACVISRELKMGLNK